MSGFDEFLKLARDLGRVHETAVPLLRAGMEASAKHVQGDWNDQLYSEGNAKLTRGGLSHDITSGAGLLGSTLEAEIGPKRGYKQSGIILLLEVGSVHNAPHGGGSGALQKNELEFEKTASETLLKAEKANDL